eukprot:809892-Pyramimonas_sp.AAC.1
MSGFSVSAMRAERRGVRRQPLGGLRRKGRSRPDKARDSPQGLGKIPFLNMTSQTGAGGEPSTWSPPGTS